MSNVVFRELGFPLILVDPPMTKVRGVEVPDINLRTLQDVVFRKLVAKPARFTGAEVRFVRKHLRIRQSDLAAILHMANHTVVSQWESRGDEPTGMEYNTELILRLWMAVKAGQNDRLPELLESPLKKPTADHQHLLEIPFPIAM